MKPASASVTRYRFAERSKERGRTTLQLEVAVVEQRSQAIEKPTGGPDADGWTVRLPTVGSASGCVGSQPGSQWKVAQVLSIVSPICGACAGIGSRSFPDTTARPASPITSGGTAEPPRPG